METPSVIDYREYLEGGEHGEIESLFNVCTLAAAEDYAYFL